MLLEEKLYVLQQLKGERTSVPDVYHRLSYKNGQQQKTNTSFLFLCVRILISLLLFITCFLMKEKNTTLLPFSFSDLQYYLTTHYFLP